MGTSKQVASADVASPAVGSAVGSAGAGASNSDLAAQVPGVETGPAADRAMLLKIGLMNLGLPPGNYETQEENPEKTVINFNIRVNGQQILPSLANIQGQIADAKATGTEEGLAGKFSGASHMLTGTATFGGKGGESGKFVNVTMRLVDATAGGILGSGNGEAGGLIISGTAMGQALQSAWSQMRSSG